MHQTLSRRYAPARARVMRIVIYIEKKFKAVYIVVYITI